MSIVEKMLEASNKTRRHLDPTGSMRMEAALKALLTTTGLTEAQLEGLANGTMVVVPVEPTFGMLNAAIDTDSYKLGDISPLGFRISPQMMFERCWRAMLAAKEG